MTPLFLEYFTWTVGVLDDGRFVFLRLLLKATHRKLMQPHKSLGLTGKSKFSHRAGIREVELDVGVQVVWLNA